LLAISGARERNLGSREAELALRFEMSAHAHEIRRDIATIEYSVYARRTSDVEALPWVGYMDDPYVTAPMIWQESSRPDEDPLPFMANDAGLVYEAVRRGVGKGLLPQVLASRDAELVNLSGGETELTRTLRVLVHRDMKNIARVAAVIEWLEQVALASTGEPAA
jgi:DNA-binding transcriptional LysR family regulator